MKSTFLVIYQPGPTWTAGTPITESPLKEHGRYLLDQYAKGAMIMAGPFTDNAGGAVVLNVANEDEARSIVGADPAVTSGFFVHEIRLWTMVPWENYLKK